MKNKMELKTGEEILSEYRSQEQNLSTFKALEELIDEELEKAKSFPLDKPVIVNFAEDLQKIINVLDTVLGDTDPDGLDPDFTEDELIDEYPIVYCFQKLNEIKSKISA